MSEEEVPGVIGTRAELRLFTLCSMQCTRALMDIAPYCEHA